MIPSVQLFPASHLKLQTKVFIAGMVSNTRAVSQQGTNSAIPALHVTRQMSKVRRSSSVWRSQQRWLPQHRIIFFLNPNPLFQCFCFCIPKFLLCCNSKRLPQLEQGPFTQAPGLEGTRSWRISDLKDRFLSSLEQKAALVFPHSSGIFLHKSRLTVGDKR